MSQPHYADVSAAELAHLRDIGSSLADIPVKVPGDPTGRMLLLPISTHVVVVPIAPKDDVTTTTSDQPFDEIWDCLVVQSEAWQIKIGDRREASRSELRRCVPMMAVVGPSRG